MKRTPLKLGRLISLAAVGVTVAGLAIISCGEGSLPGGTRGTGGSSAAGGHGGGGNGGAGGTGAAGGATGGTGGSGVTGGAGGSGATGGAGGATGGSGGATGGSAGTAGAAGKAGAAGSGGATGTGGGAGASGAAGSSGGAGTTDAGGGTCVPGEGSTAKFSFFLTSLVAVRRESGSQDGFGGDLSLGKTDSTGAKDGLAGADEICRRIADSAYPGAGCKVWRAFLSVTKGPNGGGPINAIDRVGPGPWYDRLGRTVAMTQAALAMTRPQGMDTAIVNDFPNETGTPNHAPEGTQVDNHDTLTGSSPTGTLYNTDWKYTCHDWTSKVGSDGTPHVGHSWPAISGMNWMSALDEAGCAAGVSLVEMGPPDPKNPTVGSGGGYGGFYCFALTP